MSSRKILVTTTPSLEGWEIQKYIGPVSSHVVAGANLFSDIAASWSDIFGGRSGTYQRQIAAIHEEAVRELQQRASELGATCIVGLSIDHDEIAGGGKSMFMVTATGTAVAARMKATEQPAHKLDASWLLNEEDFASEVKRHEYAAQAKAGTLNVEKVLPELTSLGAVEMLDAVLDYVEKHFKVMYRLNYSGVDAFATYLVALPFEAASAAVYERLARPIQDNMVERAFIDLVYRADLFDYSATLEFLRADDPAVRRQGLQLLREAPSAFTASDIPQLHQIYDQLSNIEFPDLAERFTRRNVFGSVKPVIRCGICGHEQEGNPATCPECLRDTSGFADWEIKPDDARSRVHQRLAVLESYNKRIMEEQAI